MWSPLPQPQDHDLAGRLPPDRPFLTSEAFDLGLNRRHLTRLVDVSLVRRPFQGVYVAGSIEDCVSVRLEVLRLVVPLGCVVTDRTAGWIWAGDRILAPNDHLRPPKLSVFSPPGHRLRSKLTASGERTFAPDDVVVMGGLALTTPLRTACDLGRLLHRDQAFAALDTLASTGSFTLDELAAAEPRYKGYRGVIQLRTFIPLVDPRAQSSEESILRLRWYDSGLPRPECQVEVETPWGVSYWLDIGRGEELFAAEYDGELFHGEDRGEHDAKRRGWMREERDWVIVVARRDHVHGPQQDIHERLQAAWREMLARKP
jgi:hypothetical protein